ncbi:MAG: pentapeptide repeat-containing protein, partial [Flavobacteriaceae bacterium]
FEDCDDFLLSFTFNECALNLSSFYQLVLKKQHFNGCKLIEADFTEAVMTAAVFKDCDLENAIFEGTVLEHADFSSAYNYSMDPEKNSLKRAIFSKEGVAGLLNKYELKII